MVKAILKGSAKTKKLLKGGTSPTLADFRFFDTEIHYYYKMKSGNKWAIIDSVRAEQAMRLVSSQPEKLQLMARIVLGNDKIIIAPELDDGDIAALPVQIVVQTYCPTAVRDAVIISLSLAILQGFPLKDILTGDSFIDSKVIWAVKACRENMSRAFAICDRILDREFSATEFIDWLYPDMKSYEAALRFVDRTIPVYMMYGESRLAA